MRVLVAGPHFIKYKNMQQENFSPKESLELIQSMIRKAQKDMSDDSTQFLIWGWITFIACTGQFILKRIVDYDKHYRVWWVIVPGFILSAWLGYKDHKKQKVSTYIGDSMKYLWMGMGISFFVLSALFSKMGWGSQIFPFFMLLYGLGTFVSGKFLQFKPLVWGGVVSWALAVISSYFDYDYQMLFAAAAILFSYIIPAYLLRRKNNSIENNAT